MPRGVDENAVLVSLGVEPAFITVSELGYPSRENMAQELSRSTQYDDAQIEKHIRYLHSRYLCTYANVVLRSFLRLLCSEVHTLA